MRLTSIGLVALLAAAVAGVGCNLEPSVPGQPGYEADVKPILEARCIRCHGYPTIGGATLGDRFDLYDCSGMPDAGVMCTVGAKDRAKLMFDRITKDKNDFFHMPPKPAAPLSPYQIDTIKKWSLQDPPSP